MQARFGGAIERRSVWRAGPAPGAAADAQMGIMRSRAVKYTPKTLKTLKHLIARLMPTRVCRHFFARNLANFALALDESPHPQVEERESNRDGTLKGPSKTLYLLR